MKGNCMFSVHVGISLHDYWMKMYNFTSIETCATCELMKSVVSKNLCTQLEGMHGTVMISFVRERKITNMHVTLMMAEIVRNLF
jgi:pullulanase/glycogen debranching enzyme